MTPFGPMVIHMDKGNFNKENHSVEQFQDGTGWITLEEYEAWPAEIRENPEEEIQQGDSI